MENIREHLWSVFHQSHKEMSIIFCPKNIKKKNKTKKTSEVTFCRFFAFMTIINCITIMVPIEDIIWLSQLERTCYTADQWFPTCQKPLVFVSAAHYQPLSQPADHMVMTQKMRALKVESSWARRFLVFLITDSLQLESGSQERKSDICAWRMDIKSLSAFCLKALHNYSEHGQMSACLMSNNINAGRFISLSDVD